MIRKIATASIVLAWMLRRPRTGIVGTIRDLHSDLA
jgi:hypothetical protein